MNTITPELAVALREALPYLSTKMACTKTLAAALADFDAQHAQRQEADSRAKRIEQGVPRYIVDGHEAPNEESSFLADGKYPPFVIFDVDKQENLPGEYGTRDEAERVARAKNGAEMPARDVVDPDVAVATPSEPAFGAVWQISQTLTDRNGEIEPDRNPSLRTELESTPGLLDRLRGQMFDEITFVSRKGGQYGVLFEVECTSAESDHDQAQASYTEVVQRLLAQAETLGAEFPKVMFAVPNDHETFDGRPAIWGFAPDGALTPEERDRLGNRLLTYAYGEDQEDAPEAPHP